MVLYLVEMSMLSTKFGENAFASKVETANNVNKEQEKHNFFPSGTIFCGKCSA